MTNCIRWFDEVGMQDVPAVGGKNASLGEMRRALTPLGIRTPDGFATLADAYRDFVRASDLQAAIDSLRHLDVDTVAVRSSARRVCVIDGESSWWWTRLRRRSSFC